MDELLEIGTIVAAQGLKGELRVYSSSDFPERFEKPGLRWLQKSDTSQAQPVKLLKGRQIPGKDLFVVQLEGVGDRSQAEDLRGSKLLVAKSDRPQLAPGEYHVSDLIDLEVFNGHTGEAIGIVTDLLWAGNDLLEVKLHQQPEVEEAPQPDLSTISRISKRRKQRKKRPKVATVLIPFVKEIVPVVDLDARRLEITPPPGLLELS